MPVDPACYALAVHFLKNIRTAKITDEDRTELAEAIQETIEDYISALFEHVPEEEESSG